MSADYSSTEEKQCEENDKINTEIATNNSDTEDEVNSEIKSEDKIEVLNRIPKRCVPNCNVPEKIIFCIDACQAVDSSLFFLEHGTTFTPHNMLKRITEFFIHSKQAINPNTEFALVVLKETEPVWMHNFTKSISDIINALDSFDSEECTGDEFELSKVFDLISDKIYMSETSCDYKLVPPNDITRLILMYNRSDCTVKSPVNLAAYELLKDVAYFTLDVIYTHENNCSSHKCEEIYDTLQSLDNGYSYMFEITRSAMKLHESIAKLLAHPFQRPLQKHASYTFDV